MVSEQRGGMKGLALMSLVRGQIAPASRSERCSAASLGRHSAAPQNRKNILCSGTTLQRKKTSSSFHRLLLSELLFHPVMLTPDGTMSDVNHRLL